MFRHYADISFDSWLRCAEPFEFLESVGYTKEEIEKLSQDFQKLLELDVHAQLAAKVRFLVVSMGGGTGKITWKEDQDEHIALHKNEDECIIGDDDKSQEHSMRLFESTKKAVSASFF